MFAAIAGGLLTALGTALLQRSARAEEQRKFLRGQLERLYTLSSQLGRWADQVVTGEVELGLGVSTERKEVVARPTDEILMVSRFYHPTLASGAEELDTKATQFADRANEFTDYMGAKAMADPVDPTRLDPVSAARDQLLTEIHQYLEALALEARRLI